MEFFVNALANLAKIPEQAGNYRSALYYTEQQNQLRDSLTSLKKVESIAQIQTKYEVAKKENQIQLLTKNAQIQRLKFIEKDQQLLLAQQQQLLYAAGASMLVLLLAVIGYFLYQSRLTQQQLTFQKDEIETQATELREAIQLKNHLFAIIGHDLRSPVASLQAWLVLSKVRAPGVKAQDLSHLEQEVNGLQHTLDNLLYWSLDQQNGLTVSPRLTDITELVTNVLDGFEGLIQLKRVGIVSWLEPLYAQTDENLTLLVLRNLLHNALKFTPAGGLIYLSSSQDEQTTKLIIEDEGVGMDLTRPASPVHPAEQGTGLGLRLSVELMNRMGGDLAIRSGWGRVRPSP